MRVGEEAIIFLVNSEKHPFLELALVRIWIITNYTFNDELNPIVKPQIKKPRLIQEYFFRFAQNERKLL